MTLSLEWSVEASYTPIQPPQQSELSISLKCPICRTSTMAMGWAVLVIGVVLLIAAAAMRDTAEDWASLKDQALATLCFKIRHKRRPGLKSRPLCQSR